MSDQSRDSDPASAGVPHRPRLLEQVHEAIRRKYFSRRTEETYVHWIKRFMYCREIVRA